MSRRPAATDLRMPIHFSRWFVPLGLVTGMWPRRCYLQVRGDAVDVAMGWAFRGTVPRAAIESVAAARVSLWRGGIGVHGWRGTWVVNGSLHRMVEIRLAEPVRVRAVGVPARLRRLYVSVADPDLLVAALG